LSIYGFCRFGSCTSVLESISLGSSISLRSCNRLGSTLSLYGYA
jgi:hypothetical protein